MRFAQGICLITKDVRGLAHFYDTVLGTTSDVNDTHVEIAADGGTITLYAKDAAIRDMGFCFDRYCGTGMCKISFFVDDVDAEYKRLKACTAHIAFMTEPTTYPWGARALHFRDPDGNILCFVTVPK